MLYTLQPSCLLEHAMRPSHVLLSAAILAAAPAFAQTAGEAKPLRLSGGITETRIIDPDNARDAAARASQKARDERSQDIETFIKNPKVYRVTKVNPVEKATVLQQITAAEITVVKIN
jgi:hypothetical protein